MRVPLTQKNFKLNRSCLWVPLNPLHHFSVKFPMPCLVSSVRRQILGLRDKAWVPGLKLTSQVDVCLCSPMDLRAYRMMPLPCQILCSPARRFTRGESQPGRRPRKLRCAVCGEELLGLRDGRRRRAGQPGRDAEADRHPTREGSFQELVTGLISTCSCSNTLPTTTGQ